jgi:hypothetical protein
MKKIGFFFFFLACLQLVVASQFHVELFEHDPFDLKNARSDVKDMNSDPCSVLRIETNVIPELYVTGQDVQRRDKTSPGEYYVFLSYRSGWVSFTAEGYLPFTYQIPLNMEPKKTYRVVLKGDGFERDLTLETEQRMGEVSISSQPVESKGAEIFVNNEKMKETSPAVIPLLIGKYEIALKHPDFLKETKSVTIQEGKTDSLEFQMRIYAGSLQAKENFWKRNKWIGLGVTVLTIGTGYYFDMQGQSYIDEYKKAEDLQTEYKAWQNSKKALENRDLCFYISIVPATYSLFSWYKQAAYRRKIK